LLKTSHMCLSLFSVNLKMKIYFPGAEVVLQGAVVARAEMATVVTEVAALLAGKTVVRAAGTVFMVAVKAILLRYSHWEFSDKTTRAGESLEEAAAARPATQPSTHQMPFQGHNRPLLHSPSPTRR